MCSFARSLALTALALTASVVAACGAEFDDEAMLSAGDVDDAAALKTVPMKALELGAESNLDVNRPFGVAYA
jgi:hypothetical protein